MPGPQIRELQRVFVSRLDTLSHILDAGAAHLGAGLDLAQARLAPDMLPLGTQVAFACNQPRGFSQWCAGEPVQNLDPAVPSLEIARAHIADTRARVLAGDPDLAAQVEAIRREVLVVKADGATVVADVADMRRRLQAAKPASGAWDAKNGPGRIMDIELMAQTACLQLADPARRVEQQLRAGVKGAKLSVSDEKTLLESYRLLWRLQCASRLLGDKGLDPGALGEGARAFLLRETGLADDAALSEAVLAASRAAQVVIEAHLGGVDATE